MKNKTAAIILSALLLAGGVKIVSAIWWRVYSIDNNVVINEGTVGFGILGFALLGAAIYLLASTIYPEWSDEESKKSGIGTVSVLLASNMCMSGACLPAAVLGTVFTVPALLCALLGAAGIKYYKGTRN